MILFLRDDHNNTIVDIEIWDGDEGVDLSVSIDIQYYSQLLLDSTEEDRPDVIATFVRIQELRGWFWEVFAPAYSAEDDLYAAALANLRRGLKEIADDLDLYYTED